MNIAGTMPLGFAFPIVQFVRSLVDLFADDDEKDDDKGEDDKFIDDLDDEEDDGLFGKTEKDADDEDEEEDDDDSKDEKKSKNSAIVQKQKYRGLYKQTDKKLQDALQRLEKLEKGKDETSDPAKAKQEKEAREYLRGLITEVLGERESKEEQALRELDEEMEELLEDNDDLTEKQVREVVEELGVTPKQAVAAIRREEKKNGVGKKAKPNVPRSKRGGDGTVDSDKEDKPKQPMTLEQASAIAKQKLRAMQKRN